MLQRSVAYISVAVSHFCCVLEAKGGGGRASGMEAKQRLAGYREKETMNELRRCDDDERAAKQRSAEARASQFGSRESKVGNASLDRLVISHSYRLCSSTTRSLLVGRCESFKLSISDRSRARRAPKEASSKQTLTVSVGLCFTLEASRGVSCGCVGDSAIIAEPFA